MNSVSNCMAFFSYPLREKNNAHSNRAGLKLCVQWSKGLTFQQKPCASYSFWNSDWTAPCNTETSNRKPCTVVSATTGIWWSGAVLLACAVKQADGDRAVQLHVTLSQYLYFAWRLQTSGGELWRAWTPLVVLRWLKKLWVTEEAWRVHHGYTFL